jgi:hypothetical protein
MVVDPWKDNSIRCRIVVDHEGLPTAKEIFRDCTEVIIKPGSKRPLQ